MNIPFLVSVWRLSIFSMTQSDAAVTKGEKLTLCNQQPILSQTECRNVSLQLVLHLWCVYHFKKRFQKKRPSVSTAPLLDGLPLRLGLGLGLGLGLVLVLVSSCLCQFLQDWRMPTRHLYDS